MIVHTDCRHYTGNKPCSFHKKDGRICNGCPDYNRMRDRILIIKLDAVGDVLRTTSILPSLAKQHPSSEITWITRKNAVPVLEGNPYIHRVVALENNHLAFVSTEIFTTGICLDPDHGSASLLSAARCKRKLGFITNRKGRVIPVNNPALEWNRLGLNDDLKRKNRKTYPEIIHHICGLEGEPQSPQFVISVSARSFAAQFRERNRLEGFRKIVGINTGGGNRWQYKKWIREYYPVLIRTLKENHPDVGILLMGGPEETGFNEDILRSSGDRVIDCGCHNSIQEFGALIGLTDVFLTPDSLGMHIAIALERVTLVTVGPTSPWELSVYGRGEILFNNELACISCYRSTCDLQVNCMNTLKPEFIYHKIRAFL